MTARRPSFWWLLAAPAASLFILGLSDPVLFIWAGVGLILGWALAASWMWGVWHERAIRAESDAIFARGEAEHLRAMQESTALVPLFRPGRLDLRVVEQRTGSHDDLPPSAEVDGFAWPEIARGVWGDMKEGL